MESLNTDSSKDRCETFQNTHEYFASSGASRLDSGLIVTIFGANASAEVVAGQQAAVQGLFLATDLGSWFLPFSGNSKYSTQSFITL